jgi:regulator of protease activity HflC (stomatin/prohibitin superfamily)
MLILGILIGIVVTAVVGFFVIRNNKAKVVERFNKIDEAVSKYDSIDEIKAAISKLKD